MACTISAQIYQISELIVPYNLKNAVYGLVFPVVTISYVNYFMETLG